MTWTVPTGTHARLRRHLQDDVLAWWLAHGPDDEFGGVFTCWSNNGEDLLSQDKYTWSQGRWAWLMAHLAVAADNGHVFGDAQRFAELATATAEFIWSHQVLPDGTCAYVTSAEGEVKQGHESVFADMFAALGFAGVAQLTGESRWAERAQNMARAARQRMLSGQYVSEPYPVPAGFRSLSLPMITINTLEQVYRATGDSADAQIVADAAHEVAEFHLRGEDIAEMPSLAGARADSELMLERHRTPGHVLELAWFCWDARDLIGPSDLADPHRLTAIATHQVRLGWDETYGGLLRYVDADGGKPRGSAGTSPYEHLVLDTWDTKLWWTNAEMLYAAALFAELSGSGELAADFEAVESFVRHHMWQGPCREWLQNLNRDGSPRAGVVALPVKDPFHIARALLKLAQLQPSSTDTDNDEEG